MLLCLLIVFIFCGYLYTRLNRVRRFADKLPGEKPWPIIGNVLDIGTNTTKLIPRLMKLWYKHNMNLFGIWFGVDFFVFLTEPDDVEVILNNTNNLTKTKEYDYIKSWLGTGLLSAAGDTWRHSRKIITPTFHLEILEQYADVINRTTDILIEKLKTVADGSVVNVYKYVTLCALDVVGESAMGVKLNAQSQPEAPVVRSIYDMGYCLMQRAFSPWKRFGILYYFSDTYKIQQKANSVISAFNDKLILERVNILREKFLQGKHDEHLIGRKKRTALLDMLLTTQIDGESLSDQMIRDEVATFIFAGHDTTTSAISFGLYCLAKYPDIQKKAFSEQQEIFGNDKSKHPTSEDFHNMTYLECFIREVLRLYPSVSLIARQIENDTDINGRFVPAHSNVLIFIYAMNRNPKYFPEPEKFDPDRFLPENRENKHAYEIISFSAGPRNCIGQKFAMLEIKAVLSKILRNFEVFSAGPENDIITFIEITLKSKNGVNVRLVPRSYDEMINI